MERVMLRNSPVKWVATGYFSMALVSTTLGTMSAVYFKNIGLSNSTAALYASYLLLAYSIKPLFSPFVEMYKNKKFFVISSQFILCIGFSTVALLTVTLNNIFIIIALLGALSFIGATQDIATDGIYITSFDEKSLARYCGFQSACWNLGQIVTGGILISFCGYLHVSVFGHSPDIYGPDWLDSWRIIFFILGSFIFLVALYHLRVMPSGSSAIHTPKSISETFKLLNESFLVFLNKKNILFMISFVFFYRLGSGLLDKISFFFLMDNKESGGLGLTNIDVGTILGAYGTTFFVIGSLIGGWYVSRNGLKNSLIVLCCAVNIPSVCFLLLAIEKPQSYFMVTSLICMEKFFLGFGAVGQMIYIMQEVSQGKYRTSHYAFGTGLLSLCFILSGAVSGYMQERMGYILYFMFVTLLTIPLCLLCWITAKRIAIISQKI